MGPELLTYCPKPPRDGAPLTDPADAKSNQVLELQDQLAAAFILGFWAARAYPKHIPSTFGLVPTPQDHEVSSQASEIDGEGGQVWQSDGLVPEDLAVQMAEFIEKD